jgi:hypothetical protein
MAIDDLQHVLERARRHQAFRRTLLRWPDQALAGYSLTGAEIRAIVEHDAEYLIRRGVEASLAHWWVCDSLAEKDATAAAERHRDSA